MLTQPSKYDHLMTRDLGSKSVELRILQLVLNHHRASSRLVSCLFSPLRLPNDLPACTSRLHAPGLSVDHFDQL